MQKLFGVVLAAESAAALLRPRRRRGARAQLELVRELAREAMEELRSVIFQLRPPALEAEGLAVALAKHVDVLRRAHERAIEPRGRRATRPSPPRSRARSFRIAQEALHNALRHARRERDRRAPALRAAARLELASATTAAASTRRAGRALAPARADVDGGAGAGGRAARSRSTSAPGAGTTVRLRGRRA